MSDICRGRCNEIDYELHGAQRLPVQGVSSILRLSNPRVSEEYCRRASCIFSAAVAALRNSLHHSLQPERRKTSVQ